MDLALWLLAYEVEEPQDPGALAEAAERICHKLSVRLARLITPVGYEALVTRAKQLATPQFPFLAGVRVGSGSESCLDGLRESVRGVDTAGVLHGLATTVANITNLLMTFVGDELTVHLLREIWPDLPLRQIGAADSEANT
jgi:hypothetical protein